MSNCIPVACPATERLEIWLKKRWTLVLTGLIAVGLMAAWRCRFVQDDAFISFHYARNLIEGQGLTWFGAHVEGYTNFLWVLWIALGLKLGINPITWSYFGGLTAFVLTILAISRLAYGIFQRYTPTLLSLLCFMTNFSVLSYATGGLETMLQTALVCAAASMICRMTLCSQFPEDQCICLSVLLALAVMTRLDSGLLGAVMGLGLLHAMWRSRAGWYPVAAAIVPGAILLFVWFSWKWKYYDGLLLPNTFFAKTEAVNYGMVYNGFVYIARFVTWYFLWPFFGLGLTAVWLKNRWKMIQGMTLVGSLVITWLVYLIAIGGDFMEFRFIIPVMPFIAILLAYSIYDGIAVFLVKNNVFISVSACFLIGIASAIHARNFNSITSDKTLDSIPALASCYGLCPNGNWNLLGDRLADELGESGAIISLNPVGAIPYYSRIKTVDQWGLNDPIVAKKGTSSPPEYRRPGHRRHATLSYLREQGVNFVIGHPVLIRRGSLSDENISASLSAWVSNKAICFNTEYVTNATVVAMPVNDKVAMLMWYLTSSSSLDALMQRSGWESRVFDAKDLAIGNSARAL